MPLVNIATAPNDDNESIFDFAHYNDHLEIVLAINAQNGTALAPRPIHPVGDKTPSWKRLHQAMHDEMNLALSISNGTNLQGDIDRSWYDDNFREHQRVRQALGI